MTKRMLIDATHPEETRVVVVNANRLDEFDFETSTKKQLKGNIYLAKVTRVEPSLQAAFVDYGGNRHGFLAFNEIHPDYWRIPIADREAVLAEHRAAQEESEHDDEQRTEGARSSANGATDTLAPESIDSTPVPFESRPDDFAPDRSSAGESPSDAVQSDTMHTDAAHPDREPSAEANSGSVPLEHKPWFTVGASPEELRETAGTPEARAPQHFESTSSLDAPLPPSETAPTEGTTGEPLPQDAQSPTEGRVATRETPTTIESIGGDDMDEVETETRRRYRPLRHYKIQEVIKRRQVLLVQVVKEERGTKGAALTTYLSLAGRYCVLMPNTARGGGISRRITSAQDRKRLKNIMEDLAVPDGMAVILRTAGMERNKAEIKRDYEYLVRQWDDIRELTLKSTAPSLVYEEGNLVKRAIRDLYSRDIEEILVEGEEGHKAAKAFMRTLMPSHVGRIQLYNDPAVPLFQRFQVEAQLDEMHGPTVRLRSGGYIVINPTEALVSIDVNSGRATRERHIEETALKTNLEAADEIARQLRLRDLAGLIVIDFIDMEDNRNQHAVERRLKEAMKSDRARIQIGRISPFGLLELSRQRLRPSLQEVSSERCPHCGGSGLVRSTESTALHVLRAIEEEGMKLRTAEATVHVPTPVALYMLNHKRDALASMETRFGLHVAFSRDDTLIPPAYRLERTRARTAGEMIGTMPASVPIAAPEEIEAPVEAALDHREEEVAEELAASPGAPEPMEEGDAVDGNGHRRRRRRRRRRGRGDDRPTHAAQGGEWRGPDESAVPAVPTGALQPAAPIEAEPNGDAAFGQEAGNGRQPPYQGDGDGSRRRRRGRRGGRRRGRRGPDMPGTPGENPLSDPRYPDAAAPHGDEGMSMPYSEPVVAAEPVPTAPPPLERPRRIEGPGDAYDWPWNRRAERFPDEQQAEPQPAAAPMPSPVSEPPPRIESPAPVVQAQAPAAVAPPPPQQLPEPPVSSEPVPPEQPSGPPRRGWWRRLTS